jgi:hypothetical protein
MTATHVHGPACAAGQAPPATTGPSTLRRVATRSGAGTLLAVLAGVTAWVLARNPLETTVFPPCPMHAMTGLWCPGCGATRASYLLLHGDVASALHFNALWVVLAPLALYQAVAFAGEAFGVRWLRRIPLSQPVIVALVASLLGFAAVRNLPFDAFEVLNPIGAS